MITPFVLFSYLPLFLPLILSISLNLRRKYVCMGRLRLDFCPPFLTLMTASRPKQEQTNIRDERRAVSELG
jgi:hypothetical protein